MSGWLDESWDDDDDDLLKAFEELLTDTPGKNKFDDLPDVPKDKMKKLSKHCSHEWENTGSSPFTGTIWWNCKHCEIAKEDYEKSLKDKD